MAEWKATTRELPAKRKSGGGGRMRLIDADALYEVFERAVWFYSDNAPLDIVQTLREAESVEVEG